ncbi:MAG: D-alpha,beta-d-heptose 7-phosphate 1-kinase, d-beta-d-heptose 1-phosphate adenylyltransferase [Patescibacteria group bacterium]|nr:D-alpha,beta-d-heptose 7-phosphate 1-kinase, d-beta-d-heptose 1-phosphate adenylyltransferase [Patescibacteria group bacterium]
MADMTGAYFVNPGDLEALAAELRSQGRKLVLTQGVFDLVHIGHSKYLQKAKELGDVLIVGVDSDAMTKKRKGNHRPIVPEKERVSMICSLRWVDFVTIRDEVDDLGSLVRKLTPDVFVISSSTKDTENFEQAIRQEHGAYCKQIVCLEPQAQTSTTARIRDIVESGSIDKMLDLSQDLENVFSKHNISFKINKN